MEEYNIWAMDRDHCPDSDEHGDAIVYQGLCSGCENYRGFEMVNGMPCVRCDYYQKN